MALGSTAAAAVALVVPLAASSASSQSAALRSDQQAQAVARPQTAVALGDGRLRDAVARLGSGRGAPAGLKVRGDKVLVEILLSGSVADVRQTVGGFGGDVVGQVGNSVLEAYVPYDRLVALERSDGVRSLRPPLQVDVPVATTSASSALALIDGDEIAKTNAAAWHAAGITGAGVKVGIVDYYDQAKWDAAQAAGEVPAPAGTFCRSHAADCASTMFSSGTAHGVAVAEVVHEMAPSAQIYLASADSVADLQDAVNWFASQGVTIVTRSLTANYDNPGDGSGPLDAVIANAVTQGITWFNSVGNNAGGNGIAGSYWRGTWSDPDADGVLNFGPSDEGLAFVCGFINGLRWSDWVPNKTDYDAYVYADANQIGRASCRERV